MKDTQTALALADQQTAIQPITPMGMLQIAVSQGADLDKLQKLMELQERWEANEARKAFNAAIAEFKKCPPRITKNKHVNVRFKDGGGMEYDHATLDNVCDAIIPALSKVGISHRWSMKQEGPRITVACTLIHEKGHSETTELSGSPDDSGKKNPIQQVASTVTYLQRYTLLAAVGMATGGTDDDGHGASPQKNALTDEQFLPHQEAIQGARDMNELKAAFKRAYTMAVTVDDQKAFTNLYEARKKVMQ